MRADRPIYRKHQSCPDTDHQTLPRLCHSQRRSDDDNGHLLAKQKPGSPNTRGSLYDPSAAPLDGSYHFGQLGKMGIEATIKTRHDKADFERDWPKNWGKVFLKDYL